MQIRGLRAACLASLAIALVTGTTAVRAEQPSYAELTERLAQVEAQLEAQSVGLVSYQSYAGSAGSGCSDCACGASAGGYACKTSCRCNPVICGAPAWYAGYEITFLRAHLGNTDLADDWDDEYGAGNRFVLGYDNGNGVGGRLRYWMFNHGLDAADGLTGVGIDMDVADAEVTLQNRLAHWDLLLSGGIRYARMELAGDSPFIGPFDMYFEGVGPTVSLDVTRDIGRRGFYLLGNLRTSILLGDVRENFPFGGGDTVEGESMFVLENQLGMGWRREVGLGELNVRSTWETQYWYNAMMADDFNGIGGNLALGGPTFSLELRY